MKGETSRVTRVQGLRRSSAATTHADRRTRRRRSRAAQRSAAIRDQRVNLTG